MFGLGEIHWQDGRIFVGNFNNNERNGFGIYIKGKESKAYIGFWHKGVQEHIGKYLIRSNSKYGLWKNGQLVKWFKYEKDALSELEVNFKIYKPVFNYVLEDLIKMYFITK